MKNQWEVRYESELVKVEVASVKGFEDHWLVRDKTTTKQRKFTGETAWSDAERFASDVDFMAVVI